MASNVNEVLPGNTAADQLAQFLHIAKTQRKQRIFPLDVIFIFFFNEKSDITHLAFSLPSLHRLRSSGSPAEQAFL